MSTKKEKVSKIIDFIGTDSLERITEVITILGKKIPKNAFDRIVYDFDNEWFVQEQWYEYHVGTEYFVNITLPMTHFRDDTPNYFSFTKMKDGSVRSRVKITDKKDTFTWERDSNNNREEFQIQREGEERENFYFYPKLQGVESSHLVYEQWWIRYDLLTSHITDVRINRTDKMRPIEEYQEAYHEAIREEYKRGKFPRYFDQRIIEILSRIFDFPIQSFVDSIDYEELKRHYNSELERLELEKEQSLEQARDAARRSFELDKWRIEDGYRAQTADLNKFYKRLLSGSKEEKPIEKVKTTNQE